MARVVAGHSVGHGGDQRGEDRPTVAALLERHAIEGQHGDSQQPDEQSDALSLPKTGSEPEHADNRGADRCGRIQQRRESGLQTDGGERQHAERERSGRQPQNQKLAPTFPQFIALWRNQQDRRQHQRRHADTNEYQGLRPKLRNGDTHEQKRTTPDDGEDEQADQVSDVHAVASQAINARFRSRPQRY